MSVFEVYSDSSEGYIKIYQSNHPEDYSVLSPKLHLETNKAAGFDFTILSGSVGYSNLRKLSTFIYVFRDNNCIFRGRVSDVKTDIFKQKNVSCEGDLTFFADTIQSPNTFVNISTVGDTNRKQKTITEDNVTMTVEQYFRSVIESHNSQMTDGRKQFTVGSITLSRKNESEKFNLTSYKDTASVISDLLSTYGGIVRTRYNNSVAYIDWLENYTQSNSQQIKFGVNMIELDEEQPDDDIWTVLLPIGNNGITIKSVNNNSMYLENSTAVTKYGKIIHYHKFDSKTSSDLLSKAQRYMGIHCKVYPDNLKVKAIDLQIIGESNDPINLGDSIRVYSQYHGIDRTKYCVIADIDITDPENSEYTIGSILPPDEKEKSSLSSKSASNRRYSSRYNNRVNDTLDGYGQDIDMLINNENQDAQDISVVADNINITANSIRLEFNEKLYGEDGTFENPTGGIVHAYNASIEATAEAITSDYEEIIYGPGGTAQQPTEGGIIAEYRSSISQTARNLTATFDEKLYGSNGTLANPTGGVVSDYNSKVSVSARNLTATFDEKLYGSNGTLANPTGGVVSAYKSDISVSARNLTATFDEKLYGSNGTLANPTGGVVKEYKSDISISARNLQSEYKEIIYGPGGTAQQPTEGGIVNEYTTKINQNANNITAEATRASGEENSLSGRITVNSDMVGMIVQSKSGGGYEIKTASIVAGINAQSGSYVKISADKINLSGYVTADQLDVTNGNFTKLITGVTSATHLKGDSISADNLYVYRSAGAGSEYKKFIPSFVSLSQSLTKSFILATDDINLAHSHAVSTGNDGTITIGGAVATDANNRSFRIADTKTYKDGVSAAIASVTVDSISYVSNSYDLDTHNYTVNVRAVASNNASKTSSVTCSGSLAYNSGVNSVTVDSITKSGTATFDTLTSMLKITAVATASNSATKTVTLSTAIPQDAITVSSLQNSSNTYDDSTQMYSLGFRIELSSGYADTDKSISFSGSDARQAGYDAGYSDGSDNGYASGYSAGLAAGKTAVLNYFTTHNLKDVYVYKVNNAYKADVTFHYGSQDYIRSGNSVRGL